MNQLRRCKLASTLGAIATHLAEAATPAVTISTLPNDDLAVLARLDQLSQAELEALLASYAPAQPSGVE